MQPTPEGSVVAAQLVDFVRRLERNYYEWRAIHLHLSRLRPHNRREFQLRIAAHEFETLLRTRRGELFQIPGGDLFYLWQEGETGEVEQVVLRLRYLFSDDPLVSAVADADEAPAAPGLDALPAQPALCTWYDLERDYDRLRFAIEDLQKEGTGATGAAAGRMLEPATLARLEASLATIDLCGLLRRQPICAVLRDGVPHVLLHELHVAVGELARRVAPGFDLTADRWLFQHLAETFDRRVLDWLVRDPSIENGGPLSINLRLATLLSPEFLSFDQEFRHRNKGSMVIELQLVDIYAELGAYLFMREYARERGYRICIDGLHHLHLPLISRKRLGADLVKLLWSPDLDREVDDKRFHELEAAIARTGAERVILCRCDSARAVSWGQALGIRLFQGHHLDSRLRAIRSPAVAAARQALRAGAGR